MAGCEGLVGSREGYAGNTDLKNAPIGYFVARIPSGGMRGECRSFPQENVEILDGRNCPTYYSFRQFSRSSLCHR